MKHAITTIAIAISSIWDVAANNVRLGDWFEQDDQLTLDLYRGWDYSQGLPKVRKTTQAETTAWTDDREAYYSTLAGTKPHRYKMSDSEIQVGASDRLLAFEKVFGAKSKVEYAPITCHRRLAAIARYVNPLRVAAGQEPITHIQCEVLDVTPEQSLGYTIRENTMKTAGASALNINELFVSSKMFFELGYSEAKLGRALFGEQAPKKRGTTQKIHRAHNVIKDYKLHNLYGAASAGKIDMGAIDKEILKKEFLDNRVKSDEVKAYFEKPKKEANASKRMSKSDLENLAKQCPLEMITAFVAMDINNDPNQIKHLVVKAPYYNRVHDALQHPEANQMNRDIVKFLSQFVETPQEVK